MFPVLYILTSNLQIGMSVIVSCIPDVNFSKMYLCHLKYKNAPNISSKVHYVLFLEVHYCRSVHI